MPEVPLTDLETKINELAEPILAGGKTGYHWKAVDEVLIEALEPYIDAPSTRCKKAGGSGRAANVLTESNDKDIDLYLIFIVSPYRIDQFIPAAKDRMARFPNIKTVAVADDTTGIWRIRNILVNQKTGLQEDALSIFPEARGDAIIEVVSEVPGEPKQIAEIPRFDHDSFDLELSELKPSTAPSRGLVEAFIENSKLMGIILPMNVATDALASVISTQQIIFAGPSGTGKSALANCIRTFFAPASRTVNIEAARGWAGPEDIVGYFSSISGTFAHTPNTAEFIDLHESTLSGLQYNDITPPFFTIEEANLSSIEGYLAPVMHAFGETDAAIINWHLHAQHSQVPDPEDQIAVPPILAMAPYPRVLMTINVDSNSPAPARKISARGAVVLMEPSDYATADEIADTLTAKAGSEHGSKASIARSGLGAEYIGRPSRSRLNYIECGGDLRNLIQQVLDYFNSIGPLGISPSNREIEQIVNYTCTFELLCTETSNTSPGTNIRVEGIENALLHFIFPRLEAEEFGSLVEYLRHAPAVPLSVQRHGDAETSGLLSTRVARLSKSTSAQQFSGMVDFWSALS